MFVHKKKHRSGRVSVIVQEKHDGRNRTVKVIGIGKTDEEVARLSFLIISFCFST